MTDPVRVVHTELTTHAATVDGIGDQVAAAGRQGRAVRAGPDSYGRLCALVPAALGALQDVLTAVLGAAASDLHDTGHRLRATAQGYRAADERRASAFRAVQDIR